MEEGESEEGEKEEAEAQGEESQPARETFRQGYGSGRRRANPSTSFGGGERRSSSGGGYGRREYGSRGDRDRGRDRDQEPGPGQVATATLQDDSGSVKVTLWNENISKVNVNDTIAIENGYVDSFRGQLQLNVGRYGKIVVNPTAEATM